MFKLARIAAVFGLAITTSACVTTDKSAQLAVTETPQQYSSDAIASTTIAPGEISDAEFTSVPTGYDVTAVQVIVPDYLVVSEADTFKPVADIVWHGDPLGDRKAQVKTVMTDALSRGAATVKGSTKVILAVQIHRFHAQTPRTRATVGGEHEIEFDYLLMDAETGAPITEAKRVDATFPAYGGRRAYRAERQGITQKVRITDQVSKVIAKELTNG